MRPLLASLLLLWGYLQLTLNCCNGRMQYKSSYSLQRVRGGFMETKEETTSRDERFLFTSAVGFQEKRHKELSGAVEYLSNLSKAAQRDPQILQRQPIDTRVREVLGSCPLLAVQCLLLVVVLLNYSADLYSIVPAQFQLRLRVQNHFTAMAVLMIDLYRSIDLSNSYLLETMEDMAEVNDAAVKEVQQVVKQSSMSHSLAFLCICLLTGSNNKSMVLPLLLMEVPLLLRTIAIISWIAAPVVMGTLLQKCDDINNDREVSPFSRFLRSLFPSAPSKMNTKNDSVDLLDDTCRVIGYVIEIFQSVVLLIGCFRLKGNELVRGSKDVALLVVKVLILLNYIIIRLGGFYRSTAVQTLLSLDAIRHYPMLDQLLNQFSKMTSMQTSTTADAAVDKSSNSTIDETVTQDAEESIIRNNNESEVGSNRKRKGKKKMKNNNEIKKKKKQRS